MLKASEAWALTRKHDKYAEQLGMIEQEIQREAERGECATWWYCENMDDYERVVLIETLKEFGYIASAGKDTIYINWVNAK